MAIRKIKEGAENCVFLNPLITDEIFDELYRLYPDYIDEFFEKQ
jgi:hypothetical protein